MKNNISYPFIADRISRLSSESAFEVLARANKLEKSGMDVVHLEIGQPDFATPDNIISAGYDAMQHGFTGYTQSQGLPEAREAIAAYCKRYKNIDASPEEIVIVPGGKPIMFFTMLSVINPGDEVIYPNPSFPIYESCINFAGGKAVPLPILEKDDFKVDVKKLKKLISERTKLIILNSPANPTGGILDKENIMEIAEVIAASNAMVLSDEIYDRIVFGDEKPFSIASLPDMKERTITLDGFSKSYAMTGWRIGYGIMNEELARAMTLLMVNSNSCAAAFTQKAIIEALNGPQDSVEFMKNEYKKRLDYIVPALNEINGISCKMPKGSFYAFPNINGTGLSSKVFADRLLNEAGVAVLAGDAFGRYGEGHIRISSANSLDNLKKAVAKITDFVSKL